MPIEALVNAPLLVWARLMAGVDLEDAARKVSVSPERLQAWEKGKARPTIPQARKLANAYKRPLTVFFLEEPPPGEPIPEDFRRLDPGSAIALSPELRLAIRIAHLRREIALDLFEEVETRPPAFDFRVRLQDDPEHAGQYLRETLTAQSDPPPGDPRVTFNFWRAATERAGVLVFQAEDVGVEEMRGFSITEQPLPVVVLNIKDAFAARTFSLLHELTHVMLNRNGLCILEDARGEQSEARPIEVFCNHVAGAALIPAEDLLKQPETPARRVAEMPDQDILALARRFGSSREAVLRRLALLNRVTAEFYERKRRTYAREMQHMQATQREKGFAPPHTMAVATAGPSFTRLALEAYDAERITASDLTEYLGLRLKHLDRVRASVAREPGSDVGQ